MDFPLIPMQQSHEPLMFATGGSLARTLAAVSGPLCTLSRDTDTCYCLDAPSFLPQGYASSWAGGPLHRFTLRDE